MQYVEFTPLVGRSRNPEGEGGGGGGGGVVELYTKDTYKLSNPLYLHHLVSFTGFVKKI